ncbi:MAG: hypothetical protein RIB93_31230 [Coleofasciculus sp. D1-CHI-01]|uniref:hypothetical protein n=1 Tax=Coleofasciculus sp. D1-CHI-01 TaxID=3068482 RepID=UPI0032F88C4A
MPTLRTRQGFSDRAMQIFSAIHPNLAYSPDANPRRDRNLAYQLSLKLHSNTLYSIHCPIPTTLPENQSLQ